ncbi:MAG: DUF882 domain-containing protein [Deltaproteobacteria bacterium]|nr:DUF882 domain-containing protein [Deltaproteobacteria bacterium]
MATRHGNTRARWGRPLLVAAAIAASAVVGPQAATAGRPPTGEPAPLALRLDDSPSLPLLDPFRHAAGRPAGELAQYLHGPYAEWLNRPWKALDWEAPVAASRPLDRPRVINPNIEAFGTRRTACVARLDRPPSGWPFGAGERHWFQAGLDTPVSLVDEPFPAPLPLEISSDIVPPWLRQVDLHWAHALIARTGCGQGGSCSPGASFPAHAFASLWDALTPRQLPPPWWVCRERPVVVARYGREQDTFVLLRCDGSIPEGALEKLSILARPPGVPRPAHWPQEPAAGAQQGEWVPGIRLLHPRLLWLLHRVALEFPWRGLYLYSGYRAAEKPTRPGTHRSQHAEGRALDISVHAVAAEDLLRLCAELPDTGCGYYPNGKFVHVDVRPRGRGRSLWVDVAAPGEPSRYVDGWPGVVEHGRVVPAEPKPAEPKPGDPN